MSITTNWTGAGDGTSWDDPDNWDNGVPNGDYDAIISGTNSASIQLTGTDLAHSVTLNDSTTTLTLTGELDTGLVDVEAGELDTSGTIATAAIYDPINDVTNFYPPTIIDPNNSVKVLGGKFDGVTYNGTLEVQPGDTLEIANGLTVNDATGNPPGDIVLDTGATLVFDDSQTLDGANISLADQSSLLQKDLSGGTELILGNDVDIFLTSASATLGGDNIATNASIEVENATLSITASSFENGGFLNARFASTVTITAANFGNYDAGTQTLTGGHFYTFGPAAMILPDNSPVSVLQSDVYLFAYDASAPAPVFETFDTSTSSDVTLQQTLTTIGQFGTLQLSTVTFTPDHAITNNGLIAMASGAGLDAAGFDNEGTIEGSGIIARDIVNNGLILAENLGGPLILAGAVTGSGHIEVAPDGTLDVIGPTSQTITLLGGGPVPPHAPSAGGIGALLRLDDPASFTGTIDIEGTGTTIEIGNVNAVNTQIQGNALIVTLANGETLDFTLAGQTSDAQVVTFAPLTWRGPSAADRSGDFNVVANWNFNLVPSGAVNAILSKPGAYTVSSAQDNSVGKLIVTDAAATLDIAAGSFNAFGLVKNAGQIAIADGASLQLGGVLSDTGTIALQSTGDATKLILPANAVIKGGGRITMSDSAANAIVSSGATASLVNFDTVEGSGTVGNAGLALVNKGIINATGSTAALNLTPGALVNHGLIEATGAAGLGIAGGIINSGGTILADGAVIAITGSVTGAGGALNIAGGAILISGGVAASQTVNFETGPGLLLLGPAELFKGTVAGFAPGDAIDLLDFAFADGPSIAHISGTGAAGTTTVVTIKDRGLTAKIALLNQFAGEFSTKAADYQLVADAGAAPGTMFELAAAHT